MRPRSIAVAVAGLVLVALLGWMFGPGASWWLEHVDGVSGLHGTDLAAAADAVRGRTLAVATGIAALFAVYFSARNADTARQGHVTDRFSKAIEQLGSDKLDVRLGGIYALERIARDSARDHPVVMEVLAAFLRGHSHDEGARSDTNGWVLRSDLRAAFQVIGRRDASQDTGRIDLVEADLRGAKMIGANLSNVDLVEANLTRVALPKADLSGANVRGATLIDAQLTFAKLTKALMGGADLSGADIEQGDLSSADLREARLSGTILRAANLRGAVLCAADLTQTNLAFADLRDAVGPVDLSAADTNGTRGLPVSRSAVSARRTRTDDPAPKQEA